MISCFQRKDLMFQTHTHTHFDCSISFISRRHHIKMTRRVSFLTIYSQYWHVVKACVRGTFLYRYTLARSVKMVYQRVWVVPRAEAPHIELFRVHVHPSPPTPMGYNAIASTAVLLESRIIRYWYKYGKLKPKNALRERTVFRISSSSATLLVR